MVHMVGFKEHANIMFLGSHFWKCMNLVKLKSRIIIFNVWNNSVVGNLKVVFNRDWDYYLRR